MTFADFGGSSRNSQLPPDKVGKKRPLDAPENLTSFRWKRRFRRKHPPEIEYSPVSGRAADHPMGHEPDVWWMLLTDLSANLASGGCYSPICPQTWRRVEARSPESFVVPSMMKALPPDAFVVPSTVNFLGVPRKSTDGRMQQAARKLAELAGTRRKLWSFLGVP